MRLTFQINSTPPNCAGWDWPPSVILNWNGSEWTGTQSNGAGTSIFELYCTSDGAGGYIFNLHMTCDATTPGCCRGGDVTTTDYTCSPFLINFPGTSMTPGCCGGGGTQAAVTGITINSA